MSNLSQPSINLPSLTVAIATMAARITPETLEAFPVKEGVEYLLILQSPEAGPLLPATQSVLDRLAQREDVRCSVQLETRGVTKSRNLALELAETELLLFCDDDIIPDIAGWDALRGLFAQRPSVAFFCGRLKTTDGQDRKAYSTVRPQRVHRLNSLRVGTPELAVRIADIHRKGLRFHTDFGAGTENFIGDEALFIRDMLDADLLGYHVAITLGAHPPVSSGSNYSRNGLAVRLALFQELFGIWAPMFRLAFALKNRTRINSVMAIIRFTLGKP